MSDASRVLRILGLVFGGIGMVMLVLTLVFGGREVLATDGMLSSIGEVVAFQGRNKPVVRFSTNARQSITIVGGTSSSPPAYDIGEQVRVYYDPAQPTHAFIDSYLERWFLPTLFGGFGVLFSLIGGGFLIYTALRHRRVTWLRKHGLKVSGKIVDVQYNRYVQLNRKPTWQIVAEWNANGVSGRALSVHMTKDPRPRLGVREQIDVWVDPRDLQSAWVDTDFLDPQHAVAPVMGPVQRRR